ncbi:unnamed protein product, partial [Thelazia callipaeda]|uniref:H15 domain-containing protein n=1 Tax=Thelazia callipaeda TaxID=103827 RepID=A0A0N5CMA5_THECL
ITTTTTYYVNHGGSFRKCSVHSRPHHNHPSYGDMIKGALSAAKDRKGSSRAAILKYILQNYQVGENASMVNAYLRMGLKRGVASGILTQLKGTGASGSFRLADKTVKKTKKVVKAKSVVTVDVKKPSPKKTEAKTTVKKVSFLPLKYSL